MLTQLSIRNYAIISLVEIHFDEKLNAIIGETGAGKSILMGALGLVLGKRADTGILMDKNQKCVVEAHFDIQAYDVADFFEANDLDYADITIIRREITPNGKSRAFINDAPTTLETLRSFTSQLIDVHVQHETRDLEDDNFFIRVLDKLSANDSILSAYQEQLQQYKKLQQQIHQFKKDAEQFSKDLEYVRYQFEELENIPLSMEEWKSIEEELSLLQNSENIRHGLMTVHELLDNGQVNISDLLVEATKTLGQIAPFHTQLQQSHEQLEDVRILIREIDRLLQNLLSHSDADEERLQELLTIHHVVNRLMQKHQTSNMDDLIQLHGQLKEKLTQFSFSDEKISELEAAAEKLYLQLRATGEQLHLQRKSTSIPLAAAVSALLKEMGMPYAEITFQFISLDTPNSYGWEKIELMFAPNKGSQLQSLEKVGSGGERSRLMLAIKSMIAKEMALPTLIFDEIDTGISGEVARKVGEVLKNISHRHQVITITHLPQIAAAGSRHFLVYKNHEKEKTETEIRQLGKEDTIFEIARMVSGDNPSAAAIENARILVGD